MVPSLLTQLRKGVLEFCVLAQLEQAPAYGLEIASTLAAQPLLFTSEGTLYPLLARLRKQGWVATDWAESASGPPRRYYTLTADGRAALADFRTAWAPFSTAVNTLITTGTVKEQS